MEVLDIIAGNAVLCHDSRNNFKRIASVTIPEHDFTRVQPREALILYLEAEPLSCALVVCKPVRLFGFRNRLHRELRKFTSDPGASAGQP
jgi:hypothetical protein